MVSSEGSAAGVAWSLGACHRKKGGLGGPVGKAPHYHGCRGAEQVGQVLLQSE